MAYFKPVMNVQKSGVSPLLRQTAIGGCLEVVSYNTLGKQLHDFNYVKPRYKILLLDTGYQNSEAVYPACRKR